MKTHAELLQEALPAPIYELVMQHIKRRYRFPEKLTNVIHEGGTLRLSLEMSFIFRDCFPGHEFWISVCNSLDDPSIPFPEIPAFPGTTHTAN